MVDASVWPYSSEEIIGRHVSARQKPDSELGKSLQRAKERRGLEHIKSPERVEIVVSDVDWEDSVTLRLRLDTLREIVNTFDDKDE